MNCTQAHFCCVRLKCSPTMEFLRDHVLYIYTVSRYDKRLKAKILITRWPYVHDAAGNMAPLDAPRHHRPSTQLLPPLIRCRASPRLMVTPVIMRILLTVLSMATCCSSVPWVNCARFGGFGFLSRLSSSRLSCLLSGFDRSSFGGAHSLPVQLLTELRGTALPS